MLLYSSVFCSHIVHTVLGQEVRCFLATRLILEILRLLLFSLVHDSYHGSWPCNIFHGIYSELKHERDRIVINTHHSSKEERGMTKWKVVPK